MDEVEYNFGRAFHQLGTIHSILLLFRLNFILSRLADVGYSPLRTMFRDSGE